VTVVGSVLNARRVFSMMSSGRLKTVVVPDVGFLTTRISNASFNSSSVMPTSRMPVTPKSRTCTRPVPANSHPPMMPFINQFMSLPKRLPRPTGSS
jgi:hypothetical protein